LCRRNSLVEALSPELPHKEVEDDKNPQEDKTKRKKPIHIEKWKARVSLAKKDREDMLAAGDKHVRAYENNPDFLKDSDDDAVYVNLIYVDIKQSIPGMYSKNPKIFADNETPGTEAEAEVSEILVNAKWESLKMKERMRSGILSSKFYGVCGFKTSFMNEKNFKPTVYDDSEKNDEVRTQRIPLQALLRDPDATSYESSSWIGHQVSDTINNIASKFGIKNKKDISVEKSSSGSADFNEAVRPEFQFGEYIEIENRACGEIFTLVTGINNKVFDRKPMFKKFDSMYDFLAYNAIPDRPNPQSDYQFWDKQLREVSKYRTMLARNAKKAAAKYKGRGGNFTEDQKAQLKSSIDGAVVELDANQDIEPLIHAPVGAATFQGEAAARQDIQIISKQAPRQSGGDKTATEVKAVEFAAREVSSEQLEILEEVMGQIARKWIILMKENYSSTRTVRLTEMTDNAFLNTQERIGKERLQGDAKRSFLVITKKDLPEDVSTRIQAGSTLRDSEQARASKLQGFVGFAATDPKLLAQIDYEELMKEGVKVFDVRNDNLLKRKENPMQESRLLGSGVFIPAMMNEDHDSHLHVHQQESKGTPEEVLHIAMHQKFKQQIEGLGEAKAATQVSQAPELSGLSFVGAEQPQQPGGPGVPPVGGAGPVQPPIAGINGIGQ